MNYSKILRISNLWSYHNAVSYVCAKVRFNSLKSYGMITIIQCFKKIQNPSETDLVDPGITFQTLLCGNVKSKGPYRIRN